MKRTLPSARRAISTLAAMLLLMPNLLPAEEAVEEAVEEPRQVFNEWLPKAFGVEVTAGANGEIAVSPLPDLPRMASNWYRCNGKPGAPLADVPIYSESKENFLFLEFDFSAAWPEAKYAKRHVVYYLGKDEPYVVVFDEIEGEENDFWTMQLPIPEETTPVNWVINLTNSDRQADLLAGVESEFQPENALNKPVSGYAKAKSGSQMLLARHLRVSGMPNHYADRMSPMNIREQGGTKFLTTEVRSKKPELAFAITPYVQNRTELPMSIISKDAIRMEWHKKSHQLTPVPGENGSLAMMIKDKRGPDIKRLGFRTEFKEIERPKGELVASYDFESMAGDTVKDTVGGFDAQVERGKLVDGLEGNSIYLGYPDRPERKGVPASIKVPESIREKLNAGHLTISFWYKPPMGQARQNKDSWMWPIGEIMRERKYLDTGFFNVNHSHYKMGPFTKGFNAQWQPRAGGEGVEPGKWNHLVFTMQEVDPSEFKYRYEVYVNGAIRASEILGPMTKSPKLWNQTTGPIMVGNLWGTIDNLQFYSNPLSEDEIVALYEKQLEKKVAYYSCDEIAPDNTVKSVPEGNYPEDQIIDNRWVPERTFAATVEGATSVPGVKGNGLALPKKGVMIPSKALYDNAQGAFTLAFYFKHTGKGCKIFNTKGIRLDIAHGHLHGAVGNEWGEKYLGYKEAGIKPDVWHHLVLTYDKRNMVMYLDGNLLYDRPMVSRQGINFLDSIELGGNNCEIDEIHLYNHAIPESEAKELAAHLPQG